MKPTLTTAESSGSMLRLPIVCSASTICAPITKGSVPRGGSAAWVPRPLIWIAQRSEAARRGPDFAAIAPTAIPGFVVQCKDRIARKLVEQPFLDHHPAAAAPFFGRLKDQVHRALKIAGRGKILGGPEQHRRMSVMTAGVHLAVVGRAVGEIVHLLDRQRVHIGTQPDGGLCVAAPNRADHPGPGQPAIDLAAVLGELCRDEVGGALFGKGELRMRMDVAAD